jgi:uncharacterized membrane protein YozB (DUF420 family)
MTVHSLPAINASLNGMSALLLIAGFIFIKRGNQAAHRNCMISAFVTSVVFLGGYLTYHATVKTVTHFTQPPEWRPIYLVVLISHTILAAAIVPLILLTLWRARKQDFAAHRRIARWTWPLWLYVSVTGVVIYLLLYQIFPQS